MMTRVTISVGILFLVGALLNFSGHRANASPKAAKKGDWLKYAIYILIVGIFLAAAFAGKIVTGFILISIAIAGGMELSLKVFPNRDSSIITAMIFGFFIFISFAHLLFLPAGTWPHEYIFIFLLIAVTDSYSQLWGKIFGRHKLCPALSPGKTLEGFAGGLLSAIAGGLFLNYLSSIKGTVEIIAYSLTIALAANLGDLLFSFIKRRLKIKDFSNSIPGHGGILDRFDSMIIAAPVSYWMRYLISN